MDETFDVMTGGLWVATNKTREVAYRIAAEYTQGKTTVVQGVTVPVTASVYDSWEIEPGVLGRPVAMFENGCQVRVPD